MQSILQNYRTGKLEVAEVPSPTTHSGGILVQNATSLVGAGTERMMVKLAQKSLIGKALERPDLVRRVIDKVKNEGLFSTIEAVRNRLDNPTPLGYSSAGIVLAVGEGTDNFEPGDRVACAGAGYASHAEAVFVPKNLAVKLPDSVDFQSGAFSTLGAIALQGLRLADIHVGETVAVIGLGLVGLLTVQLAKAAGCRVLGMDPNPERCHLATQLGCDAALADNSQFAIRNSQFTNGHGADAVLITASTKSNDPVALAGEVARDRGMVVAVGLVGMEIPRKLYYEKELTFRVSRSYGPGRYDTNYEEKGHDYPIGYVRWTEQRNMEAFVQLVAEGKVNVKPLITHRFPIEEATKAYDLITGKTKEPSLGILLTYSADENSQQSVVNSQLSEVKLRPQPSVLKPEAPSVHLTTDESRLTTHTSPDRLYPPSSMVHTVRVGLLGAGEFAKGTLLPAMKRVRGIELVGVCTANGISAHHVSRKFGFEFATTDESTIINNPDINTIVIATRHHLHARQVISALKAGKHVFVEKPLCINEQELTEIIRTYNEVNGGNAGTTVEGSSLTIVHPLSSILHLPSQILMVGFNRRFSPMALRLKEFLSKVDEPLVMNYRVNAGYIPPDHWVHDLEQGGGRIIGEVCHFVDFLIFLAGSLPKKVHAIALANNARYKNDNVIINIEFANGSLGTITYVANGDKSFSKEYVEIFGGGAAAVLENFRRLEMTQNGRRQVVRSWMKQDKGHYGEWETFVSALKDNSAWSIPFREIVATSLTSFSIIHSLHDLSPVKVSTEDLLID